MLILQITSCLCLLLLVIVLLLQILWHGRSASPDLSQIQHVLGSIEQRYERGERAVREDIGKNREEAARSERQARSELNGSLKNFGDSLVNQLHTLTSAIDKKLGEMRETIERKFQSLQQDSSAKLNQARAESAASSSSLREEVGSCLKSFNDSLVLNVGILGELQKGQLGTFSERLDKLTGSNDQKLGTIRETLEARLNVLRDENSKHLTQLRVEAATSSREISDGLSTSLKAVNDSVGMLVDSNRQRMDELRAAVETKLGDIQNQNASQLELMRQTVDEKLQGTLDQRLGESFKQVSERLEAVSKGLGEMQLLAAGVGDLKKVLTNVKTRGTWGEVQLGALLEQVLNLDQYARNVATKGGGERVDFAIKLPGKAKDGTEIVWLPIDAKFPVEDYTRLVEAQERSDAIAAETASKLLETRIKLCAADICANISAHPTPPTLPSSSFRPRASSQR